MKVTQKKKVVVQPRVVKTKKVKHIKVISERERIKRLIASSAQVRIDIGCGENKQPGWIGVDFRAMNGVDIIQDLSKFPWTNIPDDCADIVMTSHLLEHINPASHDPRLAGLIDLLLTKGVVAKGEVEKYVGEYEFLGGFIRFMDEVWRILKPGGQAIHTFPYAGSHGYWQDPTHLNPINETTFRYFDPLDEAHLYSIYRPMPWKVLRCFYNTVGFMEVALEKRRIDKSYKVTSNHGLKA